MAIKEFESRALNYFEPGYFNGDYTVPNISRAFLQCDIDKVRGGRFVTGEYYLGNYIDGTYYHNNSIKATLVCDALVVQLATVGLQGYYTEGYFGSGYYQQRGSFFTLTAELTQLGQDVFASGAFAAAATMVISVGKIQSAASTMSSQFAQTTIGSRRRNINLFASSNAALSIQVGVIKQNNIAVSGVFSVATDGRRFRDLASAETSLFDLSLVYKRSRESSMNAQAAFSLSASAVVRRTAISNISAVASMVIRPFNPVVFASDISARFSVFTSKYFGSNRPRNLNAEGDGFDFNNYFSGNQLDTSSLTGTQFIQFAAPLGSIVPKADQSWVFNFQYSSLGTTRANGFLAVSFLTSGDNNTFASVRTIDSTGTSWRLDLFKTGQATVSQTFTAGSSLTKIAVAYENGYVGIFTDNTRVALINLSSVTAVTWQGYNELAKPRFSLARNVAFDEFHFATGTRLEYNPQSSSVSATGTQTNQSVITQALYHLNGNGLDDIAVTESAASALASAFTQQTIGSGTFVPRTAQASLQTSATVSAQNNKIRETTVALSSSFAVSAVIGQLENAISLEVSAATLSVNNQRIRYFSSVENSAFTPSITVKANKVGEIVLSSAFSLSVDFESLSNASAVISAQASLTATATGITRIISVALSSNASLTTVTGFKKSAQAALINAFVATVAVKYFEGTSLIAPMAAVMTVTAVKTARITKTLSAVTSVTADAFVAEFADYTVITPITDRGLIHFNTATAVDEFGGTISPNTGYTSVTGKFGNGLGSASSSRTLTNGSTYANLYDQSVWTVDFWYKPNDLTTSTTVMPISGILALSNVAQSGTFQANGGDQNIMLGWQQNSLVSENQANGYFYFGYHWSDPNRSNLTTYTYSSGVATTYKHVAMVYEYLGSNNIRTTFYIDGVQQGVTTKNYSAYNPTTSSLVITPTTFRVTDRNNLNSFTKSYSGQLDELRFLPFQAYTANFTPETQEYNPATQIVDNYKVAYAILDSRSTLNSIGYSVVYINAELFAGTFTQTVTAARIRSTSSSQSSVTAVYANAGKQVRAQAGLSSNATVTVSVARVRLAAASISSQCALSVSATRIQTVTAAMNVVVSTQVSAIKKTGNVVDLISQFTSTCLGQRIRYAQTQFASIASNLTVAAKNATGTILLESVATLSAIAQKITDRPQTLSSQFAVTANTANSKKVGFAAALVSTATQTTIGDRRKPAGSAMSAAFTQSTNTTNSKIIRVVVQASMVFTSTASTANSRKRLVTASINSAFAVTCNNRIVKVATAALSSQFQSIFVITRLVRAIADLQSQGFQLTAGEIINIDPALQLKIEPETRIRKIQQETRVLSIESETRVNIIED